MGEALSIILPAYNEEDAIEACVRSCVSAGQKLCRDAGLERVEVVVVDDGSKDRTRERASRVPGAKIVIHPANRGYGNALMSGFQAATGDLLAFLDADGTCDPDALLELWRAMKGRDAGLVIGNRLHPDSRMPKVREIGNRFFAAILGWLTGVAVADTASGMRLFRREILARLAPLPSGLQFTPAMTARAACLGIRIAEVPIPYAERQGRSKLNIIADGFRFLGVITGIAFSYFPLRIFGPLGATFCLAALGYGSGVLAFYAQHRRIEEWMIFRLLTILTLTVSGLIALTFGLICQKVSDIATGRPPWLLDHPRLWQAVTVAGIALGLGGVLLNSSTILEYVSSGRITIHWIYVLTGGLAVIAGTVLASFGIALAVMGHLPRPAKTGP